MNPTTLHTFSFGGGVQSTAALILAAQGQLPITTFLFANVGDNAENPDTLTYVRSIAIPYAEAHGIAIHEIAHQYRDGRGWTLYDKLLHSDRSIGIPMRLEGSGAPSRRNCTHSFKIMVIAKWLRQHGATPQNPATVSLGISLDEIHRMRSSSGFPYYTLDYPLVRLRLDRSNCQAIIERAGLPIPPKSSCYFCPFHTLSAWRDLKANHPDLFDKAVQLERILSERGQRIGTGKVFMTDAMIPLDQAVGDHTQHSLFDDTPCASGFCHT